MEPQKQKQYVRNWGPKDGMKYLVCESGEVLILLSETKPLILQHMERGAYRCKHVRNALNGMEHEVPTVKFHMHVRDLVEANLLKPLIERRRLDLRRDKLVRTSKQYRVVSNVEEVKHLIGRKIKTWRRKR